MINASWHNYEIVTVRGDGQSRPELHNLYMRCGEDTSRRGFVIQFKKPVRIETLNEHSVFMLVRWRQDHQEFKVGDNPISAFGLLIDHEEVLRMRVSPVNIDPGRAGDIPVRLQLREGSPIDVVTFKLLLRDACRPLDPDQRLADGVRIWFGVDDQPNNEQLERDIWTALTRPRPADPQQAKGFIAIHQVTIVLRGDLILDEDGKALDGNQVWPGVGDRTGGPAGRPSGNGTEGGDWRSTIRFQELQEPGP